MSLVMSLTAWITELHLHTVETPASKFGAIKTKGVSTELDDSVSNRSNRFYIHICVCVYAHVCFLGTIYHLPATLQSPNWDRKRHNWRGKRAHAVTDVGVKMKCMCVCEAVPRLRLCLTLRHNRCCPAAQNYALINKPRNMLVMCSE